METLTTVLTYLNVAREDRITLYRELAMLETSMESIVTRGLNQARKAMEADLGKDLDQITGELDKRDWGEAQWRGAGVKLKRDEQEPAEKGGRKESRLEAKGKGKPEKRGTVPLEGAPTGPRPEAFPRFCQLCKIYIHSDVTCHLQGNAPTPRPSKYQKPFKQVVERTPGRGLGFPRKGESAGLK